MSTNSSDADVDIAKLVDRLLRRIHGQLNATAASFDHHKLGPNAGMILLTIAEAEPLRMQDLVTRIARDKSQMTRIVGMLEAKGLLIRREAPGDARGRELALTDAGRVAVADIQQGVAVALDEVLAPFSAQDRRDLKTLLEKI